MLPSGIVGGRSVFYGNFKWSVLCYSSVSGAFRVILSMVCFVLIVFVVVLWLCCATAMPTVARNVNEWPSLFPCLGLGTSMLDTELSGAFRVILFSTMRFVLFSQRYVSCGSGSSLFCSYTLR